MTDLVGKQEQDWNVFSHKCNRRRQTRYQKDSVTVGTLTP